MSLTKIKRIKIRLWSKCWISVLMWRNGFLLSPVLHKALSLPFHLSHSLFFFPKSSLISTPLLFKQCFSRHGFLFCYLITVEALTCVYLNNIDLCLSEYWHLKPWCCCLLICSFWWILSLNTNNLHGPSHFSKQIQRNQHLLSCSLKCSMFTCLVRFRVYFIKCSPWKIHANQHKIKYRFWY